MRTIEHRYDFVVVGAGLAGISAAVTAARKGIRTALVGDRPVLGGNASTEIRVPPVGATQCNFAYSRETGIMEELFLNNLYRNPTWSAQGWNLELENLVRNEKNIDLYLNTTVCDVEKEPQADVSSTGNEVRIISVKAYCAMAETWFIFMADHFADCSGDGVVGVQAGAVFRYGVESFSEFNEPMCPEVPNRETMGMSLQLRARDTGRSIPFVRPEWVGLELQLEDFGPYRPVNEHFFPDTGGFWWLEWGGELDTVHDTLKIKDEVQRITLAVWDYLKNRSPIAGRLDTYELDWMGAVPGKRESRRFEGDHILTMGDIDRQVHFEDAVAYGGWGFDHHPPGGFHDKVNPSTHQYLRGPHNIPLRSLYSRNVSNLFFAGRNISTTHYALSSTRVMLTCAQLGEAVGMAAAHACLHHCKPRDLSYGSRIIAIQEDLLKADHHIHDLARAIPLDMAPEARASASSVFSGHDPAESWGTEPLDGSRMQLLSVSTDHIAHIQIQLDALQATELAYSFFQGPSNSSTYPDKEIFSGKVHIMPGEKQWITLPVDQHISRPGWHFLIMEENKFIRLHVIESPPGQLRYYPRPEDPIRPNPFSKWTLRTLQIGQKRAADADGADVLAPEWNEHAYAFQNISCFLGFSYACRVFPEQHVYEPSMVVDQKSRPTNLPNLWVSSRSTFSKPEWIELTWDEPRDISSIQILFDSSLQFHFGQSWQGYAKNAIPAIVKSYRILATLTTGGEVVVAEINDNHQRNRSHLTDLTKVTSIRVECIATNGLDRVQIYAIRVFGKAGNVTLQSE
jgi:hypothetical protein